MLACFEAEKLLDELDLREVTDLFLHTSPPAIFPPKPDRLYSFLHIFWPSLLYSCYKAMCRFEDFAPWRTQWRLDICPIHSFGLSECWSSASSRERFAQEGILSIVLKHELSAFLTQAATLELPLNQVWLDCCWDNLCDKRFTELLKQQTNVSNIVVIDIGKANGVNELAIQYCWIDKWCKQSLHFLLVAKRSVHLIWFLLKRSHLALYRLKMILESVKNLFELFHYTVGNCELWS